MKTTNEQHIEPRLKMALLKGEKISTLDGLNRFGTMHIAEFVRLLRNKGHNIHCEIVKDEKTGKRYGVYSIPKQSRNDKVLTKNYKIPCQQKRSSRA
jgi:hypothetical protein